MELNRQNIHWRVCVCACNVTSGHANECNRAHSTWSTMSMSVCDSMHTHTDTSSLVSRTCFNMIIIRREESIQLSSRLSSTFSLSLALQRRLIRVLCRIILHVHTHTHTSHTIQHGRTVTIRHDSAKELLLFGWMAWMRWDESNGERKEKKLIKVTRTSMCVQI